MRSVIANAADSMLMLKSLSFTSTNTGFAPVRMTADAVAKNVKSGTITSSPGPIPKTLSAAKMASVPLGIMMTCRAPVNLASDASRALVFLPSVIQLSSSVSMTENSSSFCMTGLNSGMCMAKLACRMGPVPRYGFIYAVVQTM